MSIDPNGDETDSGPEHHDVVLAVIVSGGKVLLCHRHPSRTWFPNVWDLPGGHVELGEDRVDALAREIREELGIEISKPGSSVLRSSSPTVDIEIWAVTDWQGDIVNAEPLEHDQIGWFMPTELESLDLADPDVAVAATKALMMISPGNPDATSPSI